MRKWLFALVMCGASSVAVPAMAGQTSDCDGVIAESVAKAYPGSTLKFCFRRNFKPTPKVEVRIDTPDKHHWDMWVGLDGKILSAEEKLAVKAVPANVVSGFEAKYPKMRIAGAFRYMRDGGTFYKLRYTDVGGWHHVLFDSNGAWVEDLPLTN